MMDELYCAEKYEDGHNLFMRDADGFQDIPSPILLQEDTSVNIYQQAKENIHPNRPLKNVVSEFEATFGLWKQRESEKAKLKEIEMIRLHLQFRNMEISSERFKREKEAIRCVQVPLDGVIVHNRLQILPTIKFLDVWCPFLTRLLTNRLHEVAFMDAEGIWSIRTGQNQQWNQLPNNTNVQVFLCVEPWDEIHTLKIYRCNVAVTPAINPAAAPSPTQHPKRKPGVVYCLSFYDMTYDRIETDNNLVQKTESKKLEQQVIVHSKCMDSNPTEMEERVEPKRFMRKDITVNLVMTGRVEVNRIKMDNGKTYQVTFEGNDGHFSYSHQKVDEWNCYLGKRVQVTGNKQEDCGIFGPAFFVVDYCLL